MRGQALRPLCGGWSYLEACWTNLEGTAGKQMPTSVFTRQRGLERVESHPPVGYGGEWGGFQESRGVR